MKKETKEWLKGWICMQIVVTLSAGIVLIFSKIEYNKILGFEQIYGDVIETRSKIVYDDSDRGSTTEYYGDVKYIYNNNIYLKEIKDVWKIDKGNQILLYINPSNPNEVLTEHAVIEKEMHIIMFKYMILIMPTAFIGICWIIDRIRRNKNEK